MKRILSILLCLAMLLMLCSCKKTDTDKEINTDGEMPEVVTGSLTFKDYGTVKFELYPKKAPQSVYNFIYLVKMGWYEGIIVHRLVPDFVIQAGAYVEGFNQKVMADRYTILGEFSSNGVDNPVKHVKGTLSWARATPPNSASTQFFICTNDFTAAQLDGNYAAFGLVTEGLDILDTINALPTAQDVPQTEIMIESVTIDSDYQFPNPDFIE